MKEFLLPPLNVFVLAALLFAARRVVRMPRWLPGAVSVALAYLLCTPLVGENLLAAHQSYPPLAASDLAAPDAGAVVVLSAGFRDTAPEVGGTLLDGLSLERVLYAGAVQRATGLPILASGGKLRDEAPPAAVVMASFLRERLGAQVRWVEARSRSTWENAAFAAAMLKADGVTQAYLVTHAWHMPRAAAAFAHHGLRVMPAPTAFAEPPDLDLSAVLPSKRGLEASYYGLYEVLARLWYRLAKQP